MKVLSIIIPVYNEEKTISQTLKKVIDQKLTGWKKQILVIDDGSTDKTVDTLQRFIKDIKLIQLAKNSGRGYAVRQGIQSATGDAIIFQDGDLEYDPADWPKLISAYEKNNTGAVYGSRMISRKKNYIYLSYYVGNKLISQITNILYGSKLTDVYTCYKLFNTNLIQSIPLKSTGFEFEAEITAQILKRNIDIIDVPISYTPRTFKDGKKIHYRDGVIGVWTLIKHRFFHYLPSLQ